MFANPSIEIYALVTYEIIYFKLRVTQRSCIDLKVRIVYAGLDKLDNWVFGIVYSGFF